MFGKCPVCRERSLVPLRSVTCTVCDQKLCSDCGNYSYDDATSVRACCCRCLRSKVSLDLATTIETVGPPEAAAPTTVILLHGGGSSRAMYRSLAVHLASACRAHCVLPDLPGHGGLVDAPLTLRSAVERIRSVVHDTEAGRLGRPVVMIGGSFGGYLLMEYLAQYPSTCRAAVVISASQAIGTTAGVAASAGMAMMSGMAALAQAATVSAMMAKMARSHKHLDVTLVRDDILATGFYFTQAQAMIKVLKATNPALAMQKFSGAVLYCDGSTDHQDNAALLTAAAASAGGTADRFVAEGGDHFFTHDVRFRSAFEERVAAFISPTAIDAR